MRYYEVTAENVQEHINHIVNWIKQYFVNNGPDSKAVIGISGGKDSSIAAALCVRALGPNRVFGVLMPQGNQHDIDCAHQLCDVLNIPNCIINIGSVCNSLYSAIDEGYDYDKMISHNPVVATNTPARIRMTVLYAISAEVGGRVCNTCNLSEDYVGYATKFGDGAGDFAPLSDYTVHDLLIIGDHLDELPKSLVHKVPEDGMCGKTDEDNLGFTYEQLDSYILKEEIPDYDTFNTIVQMHRRNKHKLDKIPKCRRYHGRDDWDVCF